VSSTGDAIKRVVEAFERSDWSEIDIRSGKLRIHLTATAARPAVTTAGVTASDAPEATGPSVSEPAAGRADPEIDPMPSGAHVVTSPSPGIFWRSPEPGVPPFADIGQSIDGSATVCIVEVMKLMNHVKAGASGDVVAVYGENGVAVKKGQALFAIAPSGAPS